MTLNVRRVDSNGDWTFGSGKNCYLTDTAATRQRLKTRLRCVVNDWFLNFNYGIDYFSADRDVIETQIRRTILETDGIEALLSFTSGLDEERKLTVTALVIDTAGNEIEVTA